MSTEYSEICLYDFIQGKKEIRFVLYNSYFTSGTNMFRNGRKK